MSTTLYNPVHVTTKTVSCDKVTSAIRGSYLLNADEQTKLFIN